MRKCLISKFGVIFFFVLLSHILVPLINPSVIYITNLYWSVQYQEAFPDGVKFGVSALEYINASKLNPEDVGRISVSFRFVSLISVIIDLMMISIVSLIVSKLSK